MSSFTIQNYTHQIPKDIAIKAAQGAIVTATISLFLGSTVPVALLGSSIAATATIIEALARPLIKNIFPDNQFIARCAQIIIPASAAFYLASSTAPWIGISYHTNFFMFPILGWIALNPDFSTNKNVAIAWVL
ncbi:MAG: hypothetical protein K2X08_02925 [Chlamydiales bacterium]|nr:hypothetical protein [Chlamydiales bacterium]